MSIFSIKTYTNDNRKDWDNFVAASNNGTMMHQRSFLAYHGDKYSKSDESVMIYKKNKLVAVCPLYIQEEEVKFGLFHTVPIKTAISPAGASFGGIVIQRQLSISDAAQIVDCFIEHLKKPRDSKMYNRPYAKNI